jgi:putative ABC transport system ATP-binding protein
MRKSMKGLRDVPAAAVPILEQLECRECESSLIEPVSSVLADEPTGSLDSGSTDAVLDALTEVCRFGAALLVVTHDPDVAARCARQLIMSDGRLVQAVPVTLSARSGVR